MGISLVENQANWGIYVWRTPQGVVADPEGNIMNIEATRGDILAMAKLREAAIYYGFPDGRPEFRPGVRRVSEMEYTEQQDRFKEGYIPSETDYGAWADAIRGIGKHGDDE